MKTHALCAFVLFIAGGAVSEAAGGDDGLKGALAAVTVAESYQFSVEQPGRGPTVEAKYQKGVPLYVQADKIDFFRKGDVLVYKQGNMWQRTRTGTLSDPLRILGASAKVRAMRLPHEELSTLSKVLGKVKKEQMSFGVELTVEAAKALARTEDRDLARSGTARLWRGSDGQLTKYEIAIRVQGRRGNAEVDGVVTRTVSLGGVGTTKIELPEAAKKALE